MNWLEIVNAFGTAGVAILGTVVFGWYRSAVKAELEAARALASPTLLAHLRSVKEGFEQELDNLREEVGNLKGRPSSTDTGDGVDDPMVDAVERAVNRLALISDTVPALREGDDSKS